ncbi:MAG: chorismate mutase [Candidatus Methanofastidiosum methylothiophilum]|uniref:Chorismate mutase n=1 Tax=Candidatus Methanofastidiosum methylothiophilum TaxID=1705564 RepID=A0A150IV70_9EURY|nr:MAG: chorismate mutase [Candidatus Methanofastidiosum methylthiophilus]
MESSLEALREEINRIDEDIIGLLSRRMEVSRKIAALKKDKGIPVEDRDREKTLFLKLERDARTNNINEKFVSEVFGIIISHSKLIQNKILEEQK